MKRKIITCLLLAWLPMVGMAQTDPAANSVDNSKPVNKTAKAVNLRMLNKLTLEIIDDKMAMGAEKKFGKLRVKTFACYKDATNDAVAFLEIWDSGKQKKGPGDASENLSVRNANGEVKVFSGWMFSTSPAINPLDHAIYDVWLLGCE